LEAGMTEDGIRTIRNFVIVTVLRVVGIVIALIASVGFLIPWLIDAHNDLDLWLAIGLGVATLVGTIAVGMQLVLDFRRFPERFHRAEGQKIEWKSQ
jgi:hypothetical protein